MRDTNENAPLGERGEINNQGTPLFSILPYTFQHAYRYHKAGLNIVPVRTDGSKSPAVAWRDYINTPHPWEQAGQWFGGNKYGIAIVCGRTSQGVEVLDFDDPTVFPRWCERVKEQYPALLTACPIVATPSNGRHLYYRWNGEHGGQVLARDEHGEVRIETRGHGNIIIAPGSPPATHPSGKPYRLLSGDLSAIPTITEQDRNALLVISQGFNLFSPVVVEQQKQYKDAYHPQQNTQQAHGWGQRPGDWYNEHGQWEDILEPHGWVAVGHWGDTTYWRRPDKNEGVSATTNYGGCNLFYVFSSNASPFACGEAYSKWATYTTLEHGGDYSASCRAIGNTMVERGWL